MVAVRGAGAGQLLRLGGGDIIHVAIIVYIRPPSEGRQRGRVEDGRCGHEQSESMGVSALSRGAPARAIS